MRVLALLPLVSACSLFVADRPGGAGEGEGDVGEGEGEGEGEGQVDVGEGEGEGDVGEGEGDAGEGEGEGEGDTGASEGEGEDGCAVPIVVENIFGDVAAAVPVRVSLADARSTNIGALADESGTLFPVEVVDDGLALWFRPDLGGEAAQRFCPVERTPTAALWGDFNLVAHCDSRAVSQPETTLVGDVEFVAGVAGGACLTDANNSVAPLRLEDGRGVQAGTDNLFAHALFVAAGAVSKGELGLVSRRDVGSEAGNFHLDLNNERPSLYDSSGFVVAVAPVVDARWHDVTISVDRTQATLHLDGAAAPLNESTMPGLLPDNTESAPVFIGADVQDTVTRLLGRPIDELFVSSVPRDATWVRAFHRGVRGLVATTTPLAPQPLSASGERADGWQVTGGEVAVLDDGALTLTPVPGRVATLSFALPEIEVGQRARALFTFMPVDRGGGAPVACNVGIADRAAQDSATESERILVGVASGFDGVTDDDANIALDNINELSAASSAEFFDGLPVRILVVVDADGWRVDLDRAATWRAHTGSNVDGAGQTAGAWTGSASGLLSTPFLNIGVLGGPMTVQQVSWVIEPTP